MKKYIGTVFFLVCILGARLSAQVSESIISQSAFSESAKYKLSSADVEDFVISDNYTQGGISHVYLTQTANGFEIFNAMLQLHFGTDGKLAYSNSRFVIDKNSKTNAVSPQINLETALINAAQELKIKWENITVRIETTTTKNKYLLHNEILLNRPVRAYLGYERVADKLILAYKLIIEPKGTNDMWNVRVDALTGKVIAINNRTSYCSTHLDYSCVSDDICAENIPIPSPLKISVNATYNAYPLGVESPIHGTRQLLSGVENAAASPFGWHDQNGVAGAEYTTTRGNNVYSYDDQADLNSPGYSPNGGSSLTFNYPLDLNITPTDNMDAALTNLFVWNNFMHDVTHFYGFDEVSGNFQAKNYTGDGEEDDLVHAEGFDGSGTNNANFGTPEDGVSPTMQMYLWYHTDGNSFHVNSPAIIAGDYPNGFASFGPNVPTIPIVGDLVLMNGSISTPSQGCGAVNNAAALNGKIALVDRGNCTFVEKALNAQNSGAVAMVLINNTAGAAPTMGGTDNGQVTIPCISVTQSDGALIKAQLQNGAVNVSIGGVIEETVYDSDFDNGVICHEYGHGVSTRLTGGPQNSDCLGNDEQGGEGWSDFFALVMTEKSTSTVNDVRGIGNYVDNQAVNGGGIRPFPYARDMGINPVTYADIDGLSIPHGVGSVWCSMIWDLYNNMVDIYGHSHNLYSTEGGNNIAIRLVVEGMRYQPCDPGFVDARDAILLADEMLYNSEHECIIWKTFARRGLGYSASQGSSYNVGDETEAFDLSPSCSDDEVDFYALSTNSCAGIPVQFQNIVLPGASSYNWTFTGGTPSTSTDATPSVIYNTPGTYSVSLTATNANGTQTHTETNYITITESLNFSVTTTAGTGSNTGSATVTNVIGTGPFTYVWTGFPAVNSNSISGLPVGTYSVTVTDQTGCSATQQFTIGVAGVENELLYTLEIFPNPASDVLYLNAIGKDIRSITITDISGKKISTQILNASKATLDISGFAAGMYLLNIEIGENTVVKRFVKK